MVLFVRKFIDLYERLIVVKAEVSISKALERLFLLDEMKNIERFYLLMAV